MHVKIGGVPEHFNYPWHYGIENNFFKTKALNLEWKDYPGGTGAMVEALKNKEIDLALLLTEGAIHAKIKGYPITLLQVYVETPLQWGIYVAHEAMFTNVAALQKQKIAISRKGSGSHLMAAAHAQTQNWSINNLQYVVTNHIEETISALKKAEAAYFLWEVFTTSPYVESKILRCLDVFKAPWPAFVLVARR